MLYRCVKGGVDFLCVVTTTAQVPDVVIAHLGNHLQRAGVFAEEMLANVGAVVGLHGLVVAVQRVHHDFAQGAVFVARQKWVPVAAPDQLEHVPAGTPEIAFKLLNDLAVAAHRAIQALQIAIDNEDQVVEFFTRCQADSAHGLDFVHFAVAAEDPDFSVFGVGNAAGVQVFEKARLVDRHQRTQAHGDGGELPELRHQLGMRVARQALAIDLLAEVEQLLFGQPAFKVSTRINAGGHMALDIEAVAAVVFTFGMPEMVEAGAEHAGQRSEGADVTAKVTAIDGVQPIGFNHHGHGVPTHVGAQPPFNRQVAGGSLFLVGFDGVDIAGGGRERHVDAFFSCMFEQLLEQKVRTLRAFTLDDGRQGVHPFTRFLLIFVLGDIGRCRLKIFRTSLLGVGSHVCLLLIEIVVSDGSFNDESYRVGIHASNLFPIWFVTGFGHTIDFDIFLSSFQIVLINFTLRNNIKPPVNLPGASRRQDDSPPIN